MAFLSIEFGPLKTKRFVRAATIGAKAISSKLIEQLGREKGHETHFEELLLLVPDILLLLHLLDVDLIQIQVVARSRQYFASRHHFAARQRLGRSQAEKEKSKNVNSWPISVAMSRLPRSTYHDGKIARSQITLILMDY